jgi:two-component system chemotaxis sensor kinase CheA
MAPATTSATDGHELIEEFVLESLESLRDVPRLLDVYCRQPAEAESINAAFRAVHSIKGCAACLGLDTFKLFVHSFEHTLAEIRDGECLLDEPLEHALIEAVDCLETMLHETLDGKASPSLGSRRDRLLCRIGELVAGRRAQPAGASCPAPQPPPDAERPAPQGSGPENEGAGQVDNPPVEAGPAATEGAARQPAAAPAQTVAKSRFVRVKEERLEEFLDHVSGLFITGELLRDLQLRMQAAPQVGPLLEEMRQTHQELKTQLNALQRGVMALRQVSAAEVFAHFPHMARGLAAQLGKKINVHVGGEDTEIDRALAKDLDAPLTHLIRNAIDHGLDLPDQRRARGLDETGNLHLKAERVRNRIHITIQDDGRGIDPRRLRRKAVEKGIRTQAEADALSDEEALNLIFEPGFSTAETVSEVSGRGVGMDVVRTTLRKHRGTVTVRSTLGAGATFDLDIPIREAVLVVEGLLVRDAGQQFVLPCEHVLEIIELSPGDLRPVQGRRVVTFRGQCYDALSLREILDSGRSDARAGRRRAAALVGHKGQSLCLLFDQLLGHQQVVVKSLNGILSGCRQISGVAQLGGGRLALVLDVPEMLSAVLHNARPALTHAHAD